MVIKVDLASPGVRVVSRTTVHSKHAVIQYDYDADGFLLALEIRGATGVALDDETIYP